VKSNGSPQRLIQGTRLPTLAVRLGGDGSSLALLGLRGRIGGPAHDTGRSTHLGRTEVTVKKLLMLVVASTLAVACSSEKEPAQAAVTGLETAVAAAKPDIERFAPDRMAAVDDAVTAVKAKFNSGNYASALADMQSATGTLTAAAEAAATRKGELSADWATFAGLPATLGRIKGKVAELEAMRRLPRGMDKARLEGAKSSLDATTQLWDDATDAQEKGRLIVAVAKAKQAKALVDSLVTTLGLPAAM